MSNKRILISCPISNREMVLSHYLEHIYNINYPKNLISMYFIINNSTDNSHRILKDFKLKHQEEYENIKIEIYNSTNKVKDERSTYIRESFTYDWLSELRNKMMKECVKGRYDYILSCDSDILVGKEVLNKLLSNNVDFVASLIYNGYLFTPPKSEDGYNPVINAYKFPNILRKEGNAYTHIVNYKVKNPNLNPPNTLVEVDFTGAVFLAKREVCEVMKYAWHKQGEDCPASETAKANGFKLYCDLSVYSQHLMSKEIFDMYISGKLKYANGEVIKLM